MQKNRVRMWRNLGQLFFTFLLPAIMVVFFCIGIGRDPYNLRIAVVNKELGADVYFPNDNCQPLPGCQFANLSCRILESVFFTGQDTLRPVPYPDEESAVQAVRDGKTWAAMIIPTEFSTNYLIRLTKSVDAGLEVLRQSSIRITMDSSNQQISMVVLKALTDGYRRFQHALLQDCDYPKEAADEPLLIADPVYGASQPTFTDFMAPGVIVLIVFFLTLILTAELFITERHEGMLDRSWIAGVLPLEVLVAHVATQLFVVIGQAAITLVFVLAVFGISCEGPIVWLAGLTVLQGIAGMTYGILLSIVFSDLTSTLEIVIGTFYPVVLLCGIIWPVEAMPLALRRIVQLLPSTAACQAIRDIMARGWNISHAAVYQGYAITTAWIAVFAIVSLVVLKFKTT